MVGSHLVAELLRAGCTVRMLVRDIKRQQLLHRTLERMGVSSFYDRIEFRETALNNPHALREAVEGTDVLFHCAAQVSFDPERSDEIIVANTELATHVVNACLDSGVGLLVHVSSVATLGPARPGEKLVDETCIPDSLVGLSAYSVSKFYAENIVRRGALQGLRTVVVNPSIVIGEGDWKSGSSQLIAFGAHGNFFYTKGVKGYVDVRDVARATVLLAEVPEAVGQRYILSAENLPFKAFFSIVAETAGRRLPRICIGTRALNLAAVAERDLRRVTRHKQLLSESILSSAVSSSYYSNEKVLRTLDFEFTPVQETLRRVTRAYLEEKKR